MGRIKIKKLKFSEKAKMDSTVAAKFQTQGNDFRKNMVMLGDSTLDNVVWVKDYNESVPFLVRAHGIHVINFAADGFTTDDVLTGEVPSISKGKRAQCDDPFPNETGKFCPFDWIDKMEKPENSIFVLSVGGNDIRELLYQIHQGLADVDQAVMETVMRYRQILTQLMQRN